jgi:hypothetical protein
VAQPNLKRNITPQEYTEMHLETDIIDADNVSILSRD